MQSDARPTEPLPETMPAYQLVLRANVGQPPDRVDIGFRSTGLDVYCGDGTMLHYDLAGRLVRAAQSDLQWRRGLSGTIIELRRHGTNQEAGFATRFLEPSEADALLDQAGERMSAVARQIDAECFEVRRPQSAARPAFQHWQSLVDNAGRFSSSAALADVVKFRSIYGAVPILPPDQYNSLALMATDGCRYNRCTFCGFYRAQQFRRKPLGEFVEHVAAAMEYHGLGLTRRRSVFLGQANALAGDHPWRQTILQTINDVCEFPPEDVPRTQPSWWQRSAHRFTEITSFLDAFTGVEIDPDEFIQMRALNLRRIFIGMESGDAELLDWLRKPGSPHDILRTVRSAKTGGINVGVIVLIGAGGRRFAEQHVRHTLDLIRSMQLTRGDYVYLSPLVDAASTTYAEMAQQAAIEPLSTAELVEQMRQVRAGLSSTPTQGGPYVARYNVESFVY